MGILYEDVVIIKEAEKEGDPTVITVNCPDKTGLGCDLCRIILLFGLSISRGGLLGVLLVFFVGSEVLLWQIDEYYLDFVLCFDLFSYCNYVSTDGKWCYLVFWVVGRPTTRWDLLKNRLLEVCPMFSPAASEIYYYRPEFQQPKPQDVFLLKFWCYFDRKGLLHGQNLLALIFISVAFFDFKIGFVYCYGKEYAFFLLKDDDDSLLVAMEVGNRSEINREQLHTKERQEETIGHLRSVLRDAMTSCEIELAGPQITACSQRSSFLPSAITQDMFCLELPSKHTNGFLSSNFLSVTVDNFLSPSHTLVQIFCQDHKGLIYDTMRTLKDYNIQICYGRFFANPKGSCELDLFVMQVDGKKILDPEKQNALCSRLRMELVCPLRVDVLSRGPDTELLVANPVELSGRGRPLVFHDITLALNILDIRIFSVEIARHRIHDREWEVYRILLDDGDGLPFARNEIKECVRKKLMGWE
ncbi:hypothetical protein RHSIM_Rhsim09G0147000 [Rhododendron simsii]|uniref:ACT domain-containing protein ACR n=1 Tax=Rhododendron simsii TaxID=118357 RepID=A0A834GE37_RHOSS|nr:hypothetical protein RHSIM_Rhsim09G0147000 [Rhododendron simsii]